MYSGQETYYFAHFRFTLKVKGIRGCGRLSRDRRQDLARYLRRDLRTMFCDPAKQGTKKANQFDFAILFLTPVLSFISGMDLRQDLASVSKKGTRDSIDQQKGMNTTMFLFHQAI